MNIAQIWRRKQIAKQQPITLSPAPENAPAEEQQAKRENGVFVDDNKRIFQIILYGDGEHSIRNALGSLQLAADLVKVRMQEWYAKEKSRGPKILVPGNGKSH